MPAIIIPFRRPEAPALHDTAGQQRLAQALAALDEALAAQREAVAAWRQSLGELRGSVTGLGQSLDTYRARLQEVAQDVACVNQQAGKLEAWADGVLAAEAASPR